jgi:hypothetical protein
MKVMQYEHVKNMMRKLFCWCMQWVITIECVGITSPIFQLLTFVLNIDDVGIIFFGLFGNPNLSDGRASLCNICIFKHLHERNIIGNKIMWELQRLGLFAFWFQWGLSSVMKVSQNLNPLSFKLHHNMIGPLYALPLSFHFFNIVTKKYIKEEKIE